MTRTTLETTGKMSFQGKSFISGIATAELLYSPVGLSFWGGVDPLTGQIVDHHHPLTGQSMAGRILAIPCGRGSCSGSTVMLELLLNDCAPAALIFEQPEQILTLGILVGKALFNRSIPVVVLSSTDFAQLRHNNFAAVSGSTAWASESPLSLPAPPQDETIPTEIALSASDKRTLSGDRGEAAKIALEIIVSFAVIQGATNLLDVSRAHIDACIYTGPASLKFAQRFLSMGAKCILPTTLNSISIDQRRWKELGVDPGLAREAGALANTYLSMGAQPSFTCAPYTLENAPQLGENIGWSESNAVIYANSILGAQTQKYPDFIDVCIALTGRAPSAGCHVPEGRRPLVCVYVRGESMNASSCDEAIFPLLGYVAGKHAQHRIPLVCGLDALQPQQMDLKAFSAAFGTTASAAMFHIEGVTPEASQFAHLKSQLPIVEITQKDLQESWNDLNSAHDPSLGLVSLGNPHFSLEEFGRLSGICRGRKKDASVGFIITTSRSTYDEAQKAGYIATMEAFGASIITDTCWCMIGEPVIPSTVRNIMTNSAKYAHYAPGMVHRGVHFGSLRQCVDAACSGQVLLS